jgi:hypothetical protein
LANPIYVLHNLAHACISSYRKLPPQRIISNLLSLLFCTMISHAHTASFAHYVRQEAAAAAHHQQPPFPAFLHYDFTHTLLLLRITSDRKLPQRIISGTSLAAVITTGSASGYVYW